MSAKGAAPLLRKLALKLPAVEERPHFDMPSFRVGKKIFATARLNEAKAMVILPLEVQEIACAAHPGAVEPVPGFWGQKGATYVWIDKIKTKDFADLVVTAWSKAAPKRLVETLRR